MVLVKLMQFVQTLKCASASLTIIWTSVTRAKGTEQGEIENAVHTKVQTFQVSPAGASDCTNYLRPNTGRYPYNSKGFLLVLSCCCLEEDNLNPFLDRNRLNSIEQGWKICRPVEILWVCLQSAQSNTALECSFAKSPAAAAGVTVDVTSWLCKGREGVRNETFRVSPACTVWYPLCILHPHRPRLSFPTGKSPPVPRCCHQCQIQVLCCCQNLSADFCSKPFKQDFRRAVLNPILSCLWEADDSELQNSDCATDFTAYAWSDIWGQILPRNTAAFIKVFHCN